LQIAKFDFKEKDISMGLFSEKERVVILKNHKNEELRTIQDKLEEFNIIGIRI
jgi:hypothetical protein